MHDGFSLESLGVPTAVIVTTEFLHEARVQREALGIRSIDERKETAAAEAAEKLGTTVEEVIAAVKAEAPPVSADEQIDKHFAGKRAAWRRPYDALLTKLARLGREFREAEA